jgi:hypothetical protein
MGSWTKEDQQRYYYAVQCREYKARRRRMGVLAALLVGAGLLVICVVQIMVNT